MDDVLSVFHLLQMIGVYLIITDDVLLKQVLYLLTIDNCISPQSLF